MPSGLTAECHHPFFGSEVNGYLKIPIEHHPLTIAARELDEIESSTHLPQVVESMGLQADDLMYVARQRALRCVLLLVRKMPLEQTKNINTLKIYKLSDYELYLLHLFTACEMDGMAIGWRAQQENQKCKNHQKK